MARACGGCTACCKIMPVAELSKPALTHCQHERTGKGCAIYERRPGSCRLWSCQWLADPKATRDLRRPDRSGYVIDMLPDYVTMITNDTGAREDWPVVQVWVSASRPNVHRDPSLRAYLEKRGAMALIRMGETDAFLLSPPSTNTDGKWIEQRTSVNPEREHTAAEKAAAFARWWARSA